MSGAARTDRTADYVLELVQRLVADAHAARACAHPRGAGPPADPVEELPDALSAAYATYVPPEARVAHCPPEARLVSDPNWGKIVQPVPAPAAARSSRPSDGGLRAIA